MPNPLTRNSREHLLFQLPHPAPLPGWYFISHTLYTALSLPNYPSTARDLFQAYDACIAIDPSFQQTPRYLPHNFLYLGPVISSRPADPGCVTTRLTPGGARRPAYPVDPRDATYLPLQAGRRSTIHSAQGRHLLYLA